MSFNYLKAVRTKSTAVIENMPIVLFF